jgi:hypothetical protein
MRTRTTVLLFAVLLALAVGVTMTLPTSSTLADSKYSTQTIHGTYAFKCTGNVAPALAAPLVPAVAQGIVTSDAKGNFKGGGTLSMGGTILAQTVDTPYGPAHVNPDGTGSIVYAVSIFGQYAYDWHINFLILDEGKTIWGMPSDTGSCMLCTLQLMEKADR